MRVFLYEAFEEEAELFLRHVPRGIEIAVSAGTIQESGHRSPPAAVISIRTQSCVPPEWAGALQGILTRSTGYDHLAAYLQACNTQLPCGYLPHYCSRAVAEQAVLLVLALLRKLPAQIAQYRNFTRDGLTGREASGGTLLVVGVGKIGFEVVRLGSALGMKVLGVDLLHKHAAVRYASIDEGLEQADAIVCAMSLNRDNAGYFSPQRLSRCKPGAVFVNVARGELAPAAALLEALQTGSLGGAALDVFENEAEFAVELRAGRSPAGAGCAALSELALQPNVILTPHNAFNTEQAAGRKVSQSWEQLLHFRDHGAFLWNVGSEY